MRHDKVFCCPLVWANVVIRGVRCHKKCSAAREFGRIFVSAWVTCHISTRQQQQCRHDAQNTSYITLLYCRWGQKRDIPNVTKAAHACCKEICCIRDMKSGRGKLQSTYYEQSGSSKNKLDLASLQGCASLLQANDDSATTGQYNVLYRALFNTNKI